MPQELAATIPEDPANPHRLGRKINHDIRSADFPFVRRLAAAPVVDRDRWPSSMPILDQARLGSCVPNTGVEYLGTDDALRTAMQTLLFAAPAESLHQANVQYDLTDADQSELLAVEFYKRVTALDPFPGAYLPPAWDDTGSDGTSLGNLFVKFGLLESFEHGFGGVSDVLAALNETTVWLGTNWYDSMFDPVDGELVISPNAAVAGGHEWGLTGRVDAARKRAEMRQHWGLGWGLDGYAWVSFATIDRLLGEDGDATIPRAKVAVAPPFDPSQNRGCLSKFWPGSTGRRLRPA